MHYDSGDELEPSIEVESVLTADDLSADTSVLEVAYNDQEPETSKQRRLISEEEFKSAYKALLDKYAKQDADSQDEVSCTPKTHTQIGLTTWSAKETDTFFIALSRKNKDDLRGISDAIGTKSEPEVHAYLHLLEQSLKNHPLRGTPDQLIQLAHVPAALEVGDEHCAALESAADAALSEERIMDERLERESHGEFWILDRAFLNNHVVEGSPSSSLDNKPQIQRALNLLDLETFLDLSERIFMNSRDSELNWRSYVDLSAVSEGPSIFISAFIELHCLVVDLTKCLISSAIFLAMSRHRMRTKYNSAKLVRRQDVLTAMSALGMKQDATNFWPAAARRCNLEVYHKIRQNQYVGKYDYDDLEKVLKQPPTRKPIIGPTDPQQNGEPEDSGAVSSTETVEVDLDEQQGNVSESGSTESKDPKDDIHSLSSEDSEMQEEIYLEALDQQASHAEEQKWWKLVGKRQRTDENIPLPKRPRLQYLWNNEQGDWRDSLGYRTPWQNFSTPVSEADFDNRVNHCVCDPEGLEGPEGGIHSSKSRI